MASLTGGYGAFCEDLAHRSGFKFPLKTDSPAQSPTTATSAGSAPASAGPTDGPTRSSLQDEPPKPDGPIESDVPGPIAVSSPPAGVSAEPETVLSPVTPVVTVTPPAESTEHLPLQDDTEDPRRASTIDQAIAEFNEAVGKPKDQEASVEETSGVTGAITPVEEITAALDAIDVDKTADTAGESANGSVVTEDVAAAAVADAGTVVNSEAAEPKDANGATSSEDVDVQGEASPINAGSGPEASPPFRRHPSADKRQVAKAYQADEPAKNDSDAEGEGQTLDEIDLN